MPAITAKRSRAARLPVQAENVESRSLWSIRGMEDVSFQRGSQVNFWTVMGGLQTAALLTQIGGIWEQMQTGRWYLSIFLVNSLLIIALIWAISSWESLILKWRISIPAILTQFVGNFALAITFLMATNPAAWSLGLAVAATCNLLHQLVLSRLGAWESFSPELLNMRRARIWGFGLWPILCLAGAIHMFLAPTTLVQTMWGLVGLVVIVAGLWQQHSQIERERREFGIP